MTALTGFKPHQPRTWFGVGGELKNFCAPATVDELAAIVRAHPGVRVLGAAANLLIDDAGYTGPVVSLEKLNSWRTVSERDGVVTLDLQAGVSLPALIRETVEHGLAGLEVLAGVPASIGGAVRMNAGGKFGEMAPLVRTVHAIVSSGESVSLGRRQVPFAYRRSGLEHVIITGVELELRRVTGEQHEALRTRFDEVMAYKRSTQPTKANSAGCAFKNPVIEGKKTSAGLLIDRAGCKGDRSPAGGGGAYVSDQHANFILTEPTCTAHDVLELMASVRTKVHQQFGVVLTPEVEVWSDTPTVLDAQVFETRARQQAATVRERFEKRPMRILLLCGGPDAEADVSRSGGAAVRNALEAAGHHVAFEDVDTLSQAELDALVVRTNPDVIFPLLHGPWGEGGELQQLLENTGVPFVGCGSIAAALAMHKRETKQLALNAIREARVGVLQGVAVDALEGDALPSFGLPAVIKPIAEGSTIGLHLCETHKQWQAALQAVRADAVHAYFAEPMVKGRELTVGVIDPGEDQANWHALPAIEITPAEGTYDYDAKYQRGDTRYTVSPELPEGIAEAISCATLGLARAMGLRHIARADYLLEQTPVGPVAWFLEINTMPGFTDHSLVPMGAAHEGMAMPELVWALVRASVRDGAKTSAGSANALHNEQPVRTNCTTEGV